MSRSDFPVLAVPVLAVAVRAVAVLAVPVLAVPVLAVAVRAVAVLAVAVLAVSSLSAEPSGFTGVTSVTSTGCGNCHGSDPQTETTVTLQGGIPKPVLPGSTTTFTIVVAHATARVGGVNIAVKTSADGNENVGDLASISGQLTRKRFGEITHNSPKVFADGAITYTFTWTAPEVAGTYYLQAIANACNGDGREDDQDDWNFMEAVPIVVSPANSTGELVLPAPYLRIAPNPVFGSSMAMVRGLPTSPRHLLIIAMSGAVMYRMELSDETSEVPVCVPELPSGTYAVLVEAVSTSVRAPLVVVK